MKTLNKHPRLFKKIANTLKKLIQKQIKLVRSKMINVKIMAEIKIIVKLLLIIKLFIIIIIEINQLLMVIMNKLIFQE